MTLSSTTRSVTYTGNSSALEFDFSFYVPSADELVVSTLVIVTGVETVLTEEQYSVEFDAGNVGGTITYPITETPTPLASTHKIIIERTVPYTQDLELTSTSAFNPTALMEQLDLIVMQIQQLRDRIEDLEE